MQKLKYFIFTLTLLLLSTINTYSQNKVIDQVVAIVEEILLNCLI